MINTPGEITQICCTSDPDEDPIAFWARNGYDFPAILAFARVASEEMGVPVDVGIMLMEFGLKLGIHEKVVTARGN